MKNFIFICFFLTFSVSHSQQTNTVDFLRCTAEFMLLPEKKEVSGLVSYKLKAKDNIDSLFIDAKNMEFDNVYIGKRKIEYKTTKEKLWLFNKFKKDSEYTISFDYLCKPKKALYFIDWQYPNHPASNPQIWTQGQGKYSSNWLPSIDDMNDKIEFDLSILFHKDYEVIANGKLISKKKKNDSIVKWQYDMQQPMSSYLVALAIGKYKKKIEKSARGIPLEMYYYPKDAAKFESTYRYSKKMFDFLEDEIGVPYPWQNYKQVPVKDFLYAGMENTSTTIFSDAFVVNDTAFVDKNYVNVNAHELAHQWFGDLVTETHSTHHWLHEGFATYYALLAEKEVFGNRYYYHRLNEYVNEIKKAQDTDTIPLMNAKASSLTFYKKGALALYHLRNEVGDTVFTTSVKKYLIAHQFKNVETDDFLRIVEKESGKDLLEFKKVWLASGNLSFSDTYDLERKAGMIDIDFKDFIQDLTNDLDAISHGNVSNENIEIIRKKFHSKKIKERQVLAQRLQKIPRELKSEYEGLLKDKSYETIEVTLYHLWLNFPENRKKYLNQTNKIKGFNNHNIRILWLTLALNTIGFQKEDYAVFYEELAGYTHPAYHFAVRRNAFQYLNELQLISSQTLKNLQQGSTHHNWRFRSYCKKLLNQLTQ